MSEQNNRTFQSSKEQPAWRIPVVGGALSIVPGLGQVYSGQFLRGFLLFFFIVSIFGLSYWRIYDAEIKTETSLFPPSFSILDEDLNRFEEAALSYALVAVIFATLAYLWNIYDGFSCAEGKPAPAKMAIGFLTISCLVIGAHVTEIDIGKAIREITDVKPRLAQIAWPWDNILLRETQFHDGVAHFHVPCGEEVEQPEAVKGEPRIEITPDCGKGSGNRRPDGTRDEGTKVTVKGYDFTPGEPTEVVIKPGAGDEFRVRKDGEIAVITPDENGEFETSFVMPNLSIPSTAVGTKLVVIRFRQTEDLAQTRLKEDFWLALESIIVTIFLALMATTVGLVLAVPVSFLAARNLMMQNALTRGIYYITRLILNTVRAIEPLVWAMIAIVWVGPGPFSGVIALTLHSIAALGKLYSESIESIEPGPIEAIQATGANRVQTIVYAVIPQVIPPFVSFTIYRWDINVRMGTVIGAVGGGGIGYYLFLWIRLSDYNSVGIAVWFIAIVVTILDYVSARIRERYV